MILAARCVLLGTLFGLLLGACAVAGDAARDVRGSEVAFRPVPGFSAAVGAFLVAGPFDEPVTSLEGGAPACEGDTVEDAPREGEGVRKWRLVTATPRGQGVRLGGSGDKGYLYAQVALPLGEQADRYVVFMSSTPVAFRVSAPGRPLVDREVAAYRRGEARLARGRGHAALTLRYSLDGAPADTAVVYGGVGPDNMLAPVPVAVRLADASGERLARLLAGAMSVTLTPALAGENTQVNAELSLDRAAPVAAAGLSVKFAVRPTGALVAVGERAGPLGDLSARPLARATYRVPAGGPGRFEVRALVSREGAQLATVAATGLVAEEVERLVDGIAERGRSLLENDNKDAPRSTVAHALLQVAKVKLALDRAGGGIGGGSLVEDIASAEDALAAAEEGRDFQAGRTGFMERAYFSEVDESPQPYLVYVPTGCRPGTGPWPLVVYYHGYVPTYDIDDWVGEYPLLNAACEAEGCILAVPFGRSNTDFLTVGEDDCLRVIDEMKRAYPVDPKRVYLYGYSMGGMGVWTTLCHYPDRFAAATILSGQADMYLWYGVPRERFEPWKRFLIDCDNPLGLASNIADIPVRVYHGGSDFVVVKDHSQRMVSKLKRLGADAELKIVPAGTHWSLYSEVLFKRGPLEWMKRHALPDPPPARFKITSHSPRYSRRWGVEVTAHRREVEPVEVTVAREGDKVSVETRNVSALRVGPPLFSEGTVFKLRAADGGEFRVRRGAAGLEAALSGHETLPTLGKRAGFSGPVKDALRSPFVVVYGTGGKAVAERFAREWLEFAKGRPPVMADRDVTPELERAKTLVLLGDAGTNSVIRRKAPRLPVKWDSRSAEIAGRRVALANPRTRRPRGLLLCYPNPDAPERMVVVMSGLFWGTHLSVNHKLDFAPDLILYEDEKDLTNPNMPHNRAVVAGFFGPDWSVETGRFFVDDDAPGVEPAR